MTPFKSSRSGTSLACVKFVPVSFCLVFELSLPCVGYSPISGGYKDKEEEVTCTGASCFPSLQVCTCRGDCRLRKHTLSPLCGILHIRRSYRGTCTVEPLNNGHIGTDHFVHYREIVLFQR